METNKSTVEALLTFSAAAARLAISLRQFRRLVDQGRIAVVRISERTPRVRSGDIDAFISALVEKRPV